MVRQTNPDINNIAALLARLTNRDRAIIDTLGRHRVLTLNQLSWLFFTSTRAARDRINCLRDLDVLTRFRACQRPGSQAYRYTLGATGAYLHAAATGQPAPRPAALTRRLTELATNTHLAHLLGVNDFAARLHHAARHRGDWTVTEWLSEAEAGKRIGGSLRPDAGFTIHTTVQATSGEVALWYEYDTGTETLTTLAAKFDRYARVPGPARRSVLVELTAPGRETNLHQQLTEGHTGLAVATTTTAAAADPTKAVWWPLGSPRRTTLDRIATCDASPSGWSA